MDFFDRFNSISIASEVFGEGKKRGIRLSLFISLTENDTYSESGGFITGEFPVFISAEYLQKVMERWGCQFFKQ